MFHRVDVPTAEPRDLLVQTRFRRRVVHRVIEMTKDARQGTAPEGSAVESFVG